MRDPVLLLACAFVLWWAFKVGRHYLWKRPRNIWAGSAPITDPTLLALYADIWWETYAVIAPADRVHHTPTPHWWLYADAPLMPGGFLGYWMRDQRAVFVTERSKTNRQLIRHECAHDIMNSIDHPSSYFQAESYVMRQFATPK